MPPHSIHTTTFSAGKFADEVQPWPHSSSGTAVVRVYECGICGSDVGTFKKAAVATRPRILGHELYGAVAELPNCYTGPLLVGQFVSIFPLVACGACPPCHRADVNLCTELLHLGGDLPGGLSDALAVPIRNLFPLSPEIPADYRILVEPLAVAMGALRSAVVTPGDRCLVLGAGGVGLLTAKALATAGLASIVVGDRSSDRLRLASRLGFETYLTDGVSWTADDQAFDVVFECAGVAALVSTALRVTRPGGRVVLVGSQRQDVVVDGRSLQAQERQILGSFCYREEDFRAAISVLERGDMFAGVAGSDLLRRHGPTAEEVQAAFSTLAREGSSVLKEVITRVRPDASRSTSDGK